MTGGDSRAREAEAVSKSAQSSGGRGRGWGGRTSLCMLAENAGILPSRRPTALRGGNGLEPRAALPLGVAEGEKGVLAGSAAFC